MTDASKYGYNSKLTTDDVPTHTGTDTPTPPYTPAAHNPHVSGYPANYPSAAGAVYTGNTPAEEPSTTTKE